MCLEHKIDFAVLVTVTNANPNGDPLNGNRPRENYDGYGEISDVCIKRKIRNRLQDMGEKIFVQSDDRKKDEYKSLRDRADHHEVLKALNKGKKTDRKAYREAACKDGLMSAVLDRHLLLAVVCQSEFVALSQYSKRLAFRRWISLA